MDTKAAIEMVPNRDDSEARWLSWSNSYTTMVVSNIGCTRIDEFGADFVVEESTYPLNSNGAANGGMVSLLADQAMGVVAIRTGPTGSHPATAVLQVHFHRPSFAPLNMHARVIPGGRSILTVSVDILEQVRDLVCNRYRHNGSAAVEAVTARTRVHSVNLLGSTFLA